MLERGEHSDEQVRVEGKVPREGRTNLEKQEESDSEKLDADVRRLGKGAIVAMGGRVGGRVMLLVSQVILARVLGPAGFGLYALGWTVMQIVSLIAPLGTHDGVIRFGSPAWKKTTVCSVRFLCAEYSSLR
ncbi:MAG: hypothetical protein D6694_00260 [Gammaproteobacteria bacterium]|nr:MAG: hypothetical protein D6694_00260 [Gammaproteobacteria bacterium]